MSEKTLLTLCVHPFPASPSSHLLVGEDVQQPAPEGGRTDDDAARGQVHSWGQRGGGGQHSDQALPKGSLNDVPLVESQTWGDVAFSDPCDGETEWKSWKYCKGRADVMNIHQSVLGTRLAALL